MENKKPENRFLENSTLTVATLTSFLAPFMISAVNVALPDIQADFAASAVMLSWISTAYLLSTAVFLVPVGKIADIYGRKKYFSRGLMLLVLSSALSALAPSVLMLIAFRVLQGVGAAMIITTGMAILTSVFPPHRRGRAIGIYVAAVYVGLSVGPTAGGVMTQHFGWRSIFWAVVPLGIFSIIVTRTCLRGEWKGAPGDKFDLIGSLLYGPSLVALIYGASFLPAPVAFLGVGLGVAGLIAFAVRQASVRYPVFDVCLFQNNRVFAFSSLAALINYAATFAVTFLMSLYLQYVKGFPPQTAGFILLFQPVIMAALSPFAGRLSDRIEPRWIASCGMGLTALGLLRLVFLGPETSTEAIIGILCLLGLGFALFSSPNMNAIMGAVEKKYFGIASGAVATMRLLGQMLSMAIATVVFTLIMGSAQISASNLPLFLKSAKIVFVIFTFLCAAGIYFSMARGRLRGE